MQKLYIYTALLFLLSLNSCDKNTDCQKENLSLSNRSSNNDPSCFVALTGLVNIQVAWLDNNPVLECETEQYFPYPGYKLIYSLSMPGGVISLSFEGVDKCSSQPMAVLAPAKCTIPLNEICSGDHDLLITVLGYTNKGKLFLKDQAEGSTNISMETLNGIRIK